MSRHDASSADSAPRRPPTVAEQQAIDQAMRSGNMALAMRLAGEAAAKGVEHPIVLMLAVHQSLDRGAPGEALTYALRARALAPRDAEVLNAYGLALAENGRAREALAVYDAAMRQTPGRPGLHYNKGRAFEAMDDNARARRCYERAVELQPADALSLARLAYLAAVRGDVGAARSYGEKTLRLRPGEAAAILALSLADMEEKKYDAALERLNPLLRSQTGINRSIAEGIAGDALDALGRTAEAFRAYAATNATRRAVYRPAYEAPGLEPARAQAERLGRYFRDCAPWPRTAAAPQERTHVFLVGFPRSGTTLLEQVLAAHPQVESMEERLCLEDAAVEYLSSPEALDRLAAAGEDELESWRETYWERVGESGLSPSKPVFIDKLPLNTIALGLIARLFPDAKILFALRDPMDVVWSCFRRRFGMSLQMYEFLTLEGAARYYGAVMSLAEQYRRKLSLDLCELRYEALVDDFEAETRRVCAFLGLEWTEDLNDFAGRAQARDVNTPSSAQVARGLYRSGVGQWEAYRKELSPILPILEPWRARFGYA